VVWIVVICFVTAAAVSAFKYLFARLALRDVPPDQRVEVLDAIGRVFARWRVR
jgi:hypothetical protein